jgi:hypothetical protein
MPGMLGALAIICQLVFEDTSTWAQGLCQSTAMVVVLDIVGLGRCIGRKIVVGLMSNCADSGSRDVASAG